MDWDCTRDCSTSSTFSAEMDSSDDYLNDKIITDELANEAIILMKKKLPTYIVNSFIARGYDTPDVISDDTLEIITQLMNTDAKSMTIKLMNVAMQFGVVNCGLHVITTATSLALENDPTTVVFNNDEFQPHHIS